MCHIKRLKANLNCQIIYFTGCPRNEISIELNIKKMRHLLQCYTKSFSAYHQIDGDAKYFLSDFMHTKSVSFPLSGKVVNFLCFRFSHFLSVLLKCFMYWIIDKQFYHIRLEIYSLNALNNLYVH